MYPFCTYFSHLKFTNRAFKKSLGRFILHYYHYFEQFIIKNSHFADFEQVIIKNSHFAVYEQVKKYLADFEQVKKTNCKTPLGQTGYLCIFFCLGHCLVSPALHPGFSDL